MSRFHFDENVMENTVSGLKTVNQNIENNLLVLRNAGSDIRKEQGYGINAIYSKLSAENQKLIEFCNILGTGIAETENITEVVNRYAKSANGTGSSFVDRVNKILSDERDAINSVLHGDKDDDENGGVCPPNHGTAEVEQNNAASSDNQAAEQETSSGPQKVIYSYWGTDRAVITDEAGGIGIFKPDGSHFEGYKQSEQHFTHGEDPKIECTSTALAQCSTINGIYKQANDYNNSYKDTQIGGWKATSEDLTRYCIAGLQIGCSTVIYYNYSGFYTFGVPNGGHAVTVVGADPNPKSVYDLWVIDPWDGMTKKFSDLHNYKGGNLYICYESNPGEYGGAGTKIWDIENFFNNG